MINITLTELINVGVLQQIQDGFSKYTGMAALTTDPEGIPVTVGSGFTDFCMEFTRKTSLGLKRCMECDRNGALRTLKDGKPYVYHCHAGLVDYAAPIIVDGVVVGCFIGGQVRCEEIDADKIRRTARELGVDPDRYIAAAGCTSVKSMEEIEKAAQFLAEIAKALSDMAYISYLALEKSKKLERAARSRAGYIMDLTSDLQANMDNWMKKIKRSIEEHGSEDLREILSDMVEKGSEMYSIIGDTMDYMHIAGDDAEFSESVYDIRALIEKVVGAAVESNTNPDLKIYYTVNENVPEVLFGDADRIGQVIDKLLMNSIGMTKKGEVAVTVASEKVSYADRIIISVRDTGIGMNPEQLEEVRSYFTKTSLNMLEKDEALRLGLSVVGILVHRMSGTIAVESGPNEGTVVRISLPQLEIKEGDQRVV